MTRFEDLLDRAVAVMGAVVGFIMLIGGML